MANNPCALLGTDADARADGGEGVAVRNVNCASALRLPMLAVEAMASRGSGTTDGTGAARVPARVLVVEDDQALGELVAAALGAEGHAAAVARRGTTALHLLELEGRPDVVLLDLGLPDMTADEFARRYRALPGPHAPLVVVSGADAVAAAEATERLGAAGFVAKPFDLDALLDVVARHAA
jgi:CheY-like chemotaxis protein